jgi:hypothetical protein
MATANMATPEDQVDRPLAVWIGLNAKPGFGQGSGVCLRICFDPECPTVATSARVSWVRGEGDQAECGVEWTGARATLDEWLAPRN